MTPELYRGANNEWYWRLRARNGRIVAISGEGYKRRSGCVKAWLRVWGAAIDLNNPYDMRVVDA